jgi:hypothetical protein
MESSFVNSYKSSRATTPSKPSIESSSEEAHHTDRPNHRRPSANRSPRLNSSKNLKKLLEEMDTLRIEMEEKININRNKENKPEFEESWIRNSLYRNTDRVNEEIIREKEYFNSLSCIKHKNDEYKRLYDQEIAKHDIEKVSSS